MKKKLKIVLLLLTLLPRLNAAGFTPIYDENNNFIRYKVEEYIYFITRAFTNRASKVPLSRNHNIWAYYKHSTPEEVRKKEQPKLIKYVVDKYVEKAAQNGESVVRDPHLTEVYFKKLYSKYLYETNKMLPKEVAYNSNMTASRYDVMRKNNVNPYEFYIKKKWLIIHLKCLYCLIVKMI